MYSLPSVFGSTAEDRNRHRTTLTRGQLEDAAHTLRVAAKELEDAARSTADPADWAGEDEVGRGVAIGRADFIGRTISGIHHRTKDAQDSLLAAAILAAGFETTEES